jgi:predicted phosphoribosyltransferase
MHRFRDRREAGRILARRLSKYAGRSNVIVLGLPRGGVPVAYEVAHALGAPLDVFIVRKIGHPWNEELALGAIASGRVEILDRESAHQLGTSDEQLSRIVAREQRELERRELRYRDDRPFPDLVGHTAILVDDGLATGVSMRAAVAALRLHHPTSIVAAAPVASRDACARVSQMADECVCVMTPEPFFGVGAWYDDFSQTTDADVLELLDGAAVAAHQPVGL